MEDAPQASLPQAFVAQFRAQDQTIQELRHQLAILNQHVMSQQSRVEGLQQAGVSTSQPREPQVPMPEHYSGQPGRLRDFLLAVQTIFEIQLSRFGQDRTKILFVGTLLDGPPLSWFRALREEKPEPIQMQSFVSFCEALVLSFGDPNIVASAQRRLRLCAQGNRPASVFASEFRRIARDTGFNDQALREAFRRNLSSEVKDHLVFTEEPQTLQDLMHLAIKVDTRLFERRSERSQERRHRLTFPEAYPRALPPSLPRAFPPPAVASSSPTLRPSPMEIGSVGRRGPLSEDEKARRRRNNLCLYCGEPGHIAIACPAKSRARPATAHSLSLDLDGASSAPIEEGELLN